MDKNTMDVRTEGKGETKRRDANKIRMSRVRMVIPSSRHTLDLQFLVEEAENAAKNSGAPFSRSKFLADLIREGVESRTWKYPGEATPVMLDMVFRSGGTQTMFIRRHDALKVTKEYPPNDDVVIPSISMYYLNGIGGKSLKKAHSYAMISSEELYLIFRGALKIRAEVYADKELRRNVFRFANLVGDDNLKEFELKTRFGLKAQLRRGVSISEYLERQSSGSHIWDSDKQPGL